MKRLLHYLLLGCVLFLGVVACIPFQKKQDTAERLLPPSFPVPPDSVSDPKERASYIVKNVWLPYDTLTVQMFGGMPSMELFMQEFFSIGLLASGEAFSYSVATALRKSAPDFYANFMDLGEMYLDYPNSPVCNEDLYALFIGQALDSSVITYADSIRLSKRLIGYQKNRVGDIAVDFSVTLTDGTETSLHDIESPLTVLIFYEPECEACIESLDFIKISDVFSTLVSKQMAKVLCIDMSGEIGNFQSKADECPIWAMTGYESEHKVKDQQLYYLRTFPTIFLLDQDKRVLLRHLKVDQLEQWLKRNI